MAKVEDLPEVRVDRPDSSRHRGFLNMLWTAMGGIHRVRLATVRNVETTNCKPRRRQTVAPWRKQPNIICLDFAARVSFVADLFVILDVRLA